MDRWKILHSAKDLKQKRRNVKRSADVSGNARHFCDGELNYTTVRGRLLNTDIKHNTPPPRVAYTYTLNRESRKLNEY